MKIRQFFSLCFLLCLGATAAYSQDGKIFTGNDSRPLNLVEKSAEQPVEPSGAFLLRDVTFSGSDGQPIQAYVVTPQGAGPCAGILFVHWLGDPKTTNRTQFLPE